MMLWTIPPNTCWMFLGTMSHQCKIMLWFGTEGRTFGKQRWWFVLLKGLEKDSSVSVSTFDSRYTEQADTAIGWNVVTPFLKCSSIKAYWTCLIFSLANLSCSPEASCILSDSLSRRVDTGMGAVIGLPMEGEAPASPARLAGAGIAQETWYHIMARGWCLKGLLEHPLPTCTNSPIPIKPIDDREASSGFSLH